MGDVVHEIQAAIDLAVVAVLAVVVEEAHNGRQSMSSSKPGLITYQFLTSTTFTSQPKMVIATQDYIYFLYSI